MADLKRKRSASPTNEPESGEKRVKVLSGGQRKKAPGFSDKIANETSYIIQNGLRYVKPYYFTFESFAKGRWAGRTVFDVFSKEFQSEKPEYYKKAIESGRITVGGKVVSVDTVIQKNTLIRHKIHRHEPPVLHHPLKIVYQDNDMLVVDKPPSIPVHPCGRYRHNTVVFLLAKEHGIKNVHTIHRIDRLTSGILMFAKTLHKAQQIEEEIRNKVVTKTYLAKVKGEFPKDLIECTEPIVVVSHKLGVCHVDPGGKPCSTSFIRLHYDGNASLVKCIPHTGRMHQIRVHLQWLGYPILNDPLYNHPAWGPNRACKGEGIKSMDEVLSKIVESRFIDDIVATDDKEARGTPDVPPLVPAPNPLGTTVCSDHAGSDNISKGSDGSTAISTSKSHYITKGSDADPSTDDIRPGSDVGPDTSTASATTNKNADCGSVESTSKTPLNVEPRTTSSSAPEFTKDPNCTECCLSRTDPAPSDLVMFLHALKYSGQDWEYTTEPPYWAAEELALTHTTTNQSCT